MTFLAASLTARGGGLGGGGSVGGVVGDSRGCGVFGVSEVVI